ncbi:hypothetical protein GCM10027167_68660 [Nocardia heshunensis]
MRVADIDWMHGTGPEIRGPITALLLLITGRPTHVPDLTGDGVPLATARLRIRST